MSSEPSTRPMGANENLQGPEIQFYIPATSSLLERRPRTLKHGDMFGVFDHYGDIFGGEGSPEGLFYKDTRYLSHLEILLDGRRPLLLSSTVQDNNSLLTVDLTNPDFLARRRLALPRDTIHVTRSKFLWEGGCYERLGLHNFDSRAHHVELGFRFEADFADIFEVRGHVREQRGRTLPVAVGRDRITFAYEGLDGTVRRTVIVFDPAPAAIDETSAAHRLTLAPRERLSVFGAVLCSDEPAPPTAKPLFASWRAARRELRSSTRRAASVETSNDVLNEALCRSVADLYMLLTNSEHGPYPYAGIPWFSTPFGRDGLITALLLLWIDPEIAKGVLRFLAATQATTLDPTSDAEPGKILHETRKGEMAALGEVPFGLYYGSVDATPLFVLLAGKYLERAGDLETISELWPRIKEALKWIDEFGDRDGDGFYEYDAQSGEGLSNQGWKDSSDSIFHEDSKLARGPVALCEVQAYVYAAKQSAANMARALGSAALAVTLDEQAGALRERFNAVFWDPDLAFYALALDGDKRPCRVRASNAGQVLFTGIASAEQARAIAGQLMSQSFFSGWGIRTVANSEARYNPMSYHNGSIWPHDNALIALGFGRYELIDHLEPLFAGLLDAMRYMDLRRLPELFCGFRRTRGKGPTFYPVACAPQAWASAAPFGLLQAWFGLEMDHVANEIRFRRPRLPRSLNEITIRHLELGASHLDLVLRRHGPDVSADVTHRVGDARVVVMQ